MSPDRFDIETAHRRHTSAAGSQSLVVRTRVAARRDRLTRELTVGAEPSSSPERALHAAQLTSPRGREQLARGLRRAVAEARGPQLIRSPVVIIDRAQVLGAEAAINAMVARLGDAEPVRAEGMAIAHRILTNADGSPLYNATEPGALRRQMLLRPRPWTRHPQQTSSYRSRRSS
jgi:hypothetical protein